MTENLVRMAIHPFTQLSSMMSGANQLNAMESVILTMEKGHQFQIVSVNKKVEK